MRVGAFLAICTTLAVASPAPAQELRATSLHGEPIVLEVGGEPGRASAAALVFAGGCERRPPSSNFKPPSGVVELRLPACDPAASSERRLLDVLAAAAHLRAKAPWWNRRLYLIGAGEGATLAPPPQPCCPRPRAWC
jgi:hypothetical protein